MKKYSGVLLALLLLFSSVCPASPASWSDWQHDLWGQATAQANGKRHNRPVLLYFHVDWCGWCRRLDSQYLRSPHMASTLAMFEKAELNPEKNDANRRLFDKFGGTGYPSLYLFLPGSDTAPVKVTPFRQNRQFTVQEFAEHLRAAAARQYNRWGFELQKQADFETALEVFSKSLAYDPRNTYALYMQGRTHHQIGHQQRDLAHLRRAKTAYQRALLTDPNHEPSQNGLKGLSALGD